MREQDILDRIFTTIGTTNRYAVEFGARDGVAGSNTHRLRTVHGWSALLLDCKPAGPGVKWAWLTAENIAHEFARHGVPAEFDLLSIDIDGNDFHVWRALQAYRPRVVIIEYNSKWGPTESVVIPYDPARRWDRTDYYGASAAALVKLGREKGYALVDVVPRVNLIFVREDVRQAADLPACDVPKAEPYGYPVARRPWEAY